MPQYKDLQTGEILTQEEFDMVPGETDILSQALQKPKSLLQKLGIGAQKVAEPLAKAGEFLGMKPLGTYLASKIPGLPAEVEQPYSGKQITGSVLQTAATAIPLGKAPTLLAKVAQWVGIGGAIGFGKGLEEDKTIGESAKQGAISGAISGAFPIAGKGISKGLEKVKKPIGEVVSSVLGNMIGKPPEVIQRAFSNTDEVGRALSNHKIPENIRIESIGLLKELRKEAKTIFGIGLKEQQKLHPFGKTGQILVKKDFGNLQQNIANTMRNFGVSVSKEGLNFDKLMSPIINSTERNQVKLAYQTVLSQKNFTPKGVQKVAARLSKLSKYGEGLIKESSAIIGKIHSLYTKGIGKTYPELGKLRGQYKIEKKIYSEIENLLSSDKWKPTEITTAIKRLSNVFAEDNEVYLKTLMKLEQKTGRDLLSELAASEFAKYAPASFGSRVAQAGLLAGGLIFRPYILLVLPLFSPRFVGRATIIAGKIATKIPGVIEKGAEIGKRTIPHLIKNFEFK